MSNSTAPPFCSLTRTARIVPLTRPQTVTPCAMTLPSTCAPSLIRSSEARNSPSIRPKTCAGPLHSILPTIDMSEPMQEAVPAFVVGSDLAQAWSCGCTILPITSGAFAATLLSFSGAPLFMLLNMSTSFFAGMRVRCAKSGRFFDATPTLPCLNARCRAILSDIHILGGGDWTRWLGWEDLKCAGRPARSSGAESCARIAAVRATAGVAGGTYVFCLPGSPRACHAWDEILVHQLDYRHRPCNFVESYRASTRSCAAP